MFSVLLIPVLLLGSSYAILNQPSCTDDSQCAATECCQILSEFMIVSRRGLPQLATKPPRTGTCQPYKNEGDYCDVFAKPNGYCSCAPGLSCKGIEVYVGTPPPTTLSILQPAAPIQKRSMLPPRPGYRWEYKCRKIVI